MSGGSQGGHEGRGDGGVASRSPNPNSDSLTPTPTPPPPPTHLVLDPLLLQHPADQLALLHRGGPHQHRAPLLVDARDLGDDGGPLVLLQPARGWGRMGEGWGGWGWMGGRGRGRYGV